jgi:hypothetical protein
MGFQRVRDSPTLLLGLLLSFEYWCSVEIARTGCVERGPRTHPLKQRPEVRTRRACNARGPIRESKAQDGGTTPTEASPSWVCSIPRDYDPSHLTDSPCLDGDFGVLFESTRAR